MIQGIFPDFTGRGLAFNKKNNMQDKELNGCSRGFYAGATAEAASGDLTKIFLLLFTGIHIHRQNTGGQAHGSTRDEVIVL